MVVLGCAPRKLQTFQYNHNLYVVGARTIDPKYKMYDLQFVGAGAGVNRMGSANVAAAALSTKGAKVALINKDDFASFTSMFMGLELKKSSSYVSW